jgi:hypothetical protein
MTDDTQIEWKTSWPLQLAASLNPARAAVGVVLFVALRLRCSVTFARYRIPPRSLTSRSMSSLLRLLLSPCCLTPFGPAYRTYYTRSHGGANRISAREVSSSHDTSVRLRLSSKN